METYLLYVHGRNKRETSWPRKLSTTADCCPRLVKWRAASLGGSQPQSLLAPAPMRNHGSGRSSGRFRSLHH
eukprot:2304633-Rhodomonas_salina.1